MSCPHWKISLRLSNRLRSIIWTYGFVFINCYWRKVTMSKQHSKGLIIMRNIIYTNGGFLSLCLKNTSTKFLRIMDQMLKCLNFPKCYIDGIIIFSLTLRNHNMHHLQEVFGKLNEHKFKFHLGKCWFFHIQI
jgi:hypothetical protein